MYFLSYLLNILLLLLLLLIWQLNVFCTISRTSIKWLNLVYLLKCFEIVKCGSTVVLCSVDNMLNHICQHLKHHYKFYLNLECCCPRRHIVIINFIPVLTWKTIFDSHRICSRCIASSYLIILIGFHSHGFRQKADLSMSIWK